jgi:hypothetical protein
MLVLTRLGRKSSNSNFKTCAGIKDSSTETVDVKEPADAAFSVKWQEPLRTAIFFHVSSWLIRTC